MDLKSVSLLETRLIAHIMEIDVILAIIQYKFRNSQDIIQRAPKMYPPVTQPLCFIRAVVTKCDAMR